MGVGFCCKLTEKEILVYDQMALPKEELYCKFMIMKDGSLVYTGVKYWNDFLFTDWNDIGPLITDRDAICGLEIIKEKNLDYDPDWEF